MKWLDGMHMSLSKLRETVKDREVWRAAVHGVTKSDAAEQVNDNRWKSNCFNNHIKCKSSKYGN